MQYIGQNKPVIAQASAGVDLHVYPACDQITCDVPGAIYERSSSSSTVAWTAESGVEYMLLVTSPIFPDQDLTGGNFTLSVSISIVSDFRDNADGWTTYDVDGDVQSFRHVTSGGNPDGFITASDVFGQSIWYYEAPPKFHGDVLGCTLRYELKQSLIDNPSLLDDIYVLDKLSLVRLNYKFGRNPGLNWTSFEATFDKGKEWLDKDGNIAGDSLVTSTFSDISLIRIRGEYRIGEDTSSLDNVILTC
jgi:hypothetical protein